MNSKINEKIKRKIKTIVNYQFSSLKIKCTMCRNPFSDKTIIPHIKDCGLKEHAVPDPPVPAHGDHVLPVRDLPLPAPPRTTLAQGLPPSLLLCATGEQTQENLRYAIYA